MKFTQNRGVDAVQLGREVMPDKILVANCSALSKKYGERGLKLILQAVGTLVAADKKKGLTAQLIDISSATAMKKFKAKAVTLAKSERQCKDAVDAIYRAFTPSYLVLLDGPDVLPHVILDNPALGDGDKDVPSDLPYASDAPSGSRDAAAYASVTRVVGRIPGITAATDPSFVVKQILAAANFTTRRRGDYLNHFAISAEVWNKSTAQSVDNIFGSPAIKLCPPTQSPAVSKLLAPLSHFINCHGAEVDPKFYGQRQSQYPIAMTSDDVTKGAKRNALIAAECCYGAQLYDPALAQGQWPISNSYLGAGAVGFFGSTTIAYGPAEGNGSADLLTQYFLINALNGASLGRACLQARQKFVLGEKMEDPINLKTLAQFILLADPSLQPCRAEGEQAAINAKAVDDEASRRTRRVALVAAGKSAADSSGYPGKQLARPSKRLSTLVLKLARGHGFGARAKDLVGFSVVGRGHYAVEMKARGVEQKVLMLMEHRRPRGKALKAMPKGLRQTHIFVTHTQDDRIVEVAEYVRR
jgi:hypothetical protein